MRQRPDKEDSIAFLREQYDSNLENLDRHPANDPIYIEIAASSWKQITEYARGYPSLGGKELVETMGLTPVQAAAALEKLRNEGVAYKPANPKYLSPMQGTTPLSPWDLHIVNDSVGFESYSEEWARKRPNHQPKPEKPDVTKIGKQVVNSVQAIDDVEKDSQTNQSKPAPEQPRLDTLLTKRATNPENIREKAKDTWELTLLYLAGKLNKEGKQPPSMSPASLASKYVKYFKLDRTYIDKGMDREKARRTAFDDILPVAQQNFVKLQNLGIVDVTHVSIDSHDPSHDTSTTGHKVLQTPREIIEELHNYREQDK